MDELIDLIKEQVSELENKAFDLRLSFPEDIDRRRQALEKITEREMIMDAIDSLDSTLQDFKVGLNKLKASFLKGEK